MGDLWFGKNRHHAYLSNLVQTLHRDNKQRIDRLEDQQSPDPFEFYYTKKNAVTSQVVL